MVTHTKINNNSVSIVFFVLEEQALFCAVAINSIIINTKRLKNIYVFIENEITRRKVWCNVINKIENKIKFILVNEENKSSIPNKIFLQRDSYKLYTILKHIKEHWVLLLDVGIFLQDNLLKLFSKALIVFIISFVVCAYEINQVPLPVILIPLFCLF